jgi:hypothetical protein
VSDVAFGVGIATLVAAAYVYFTRSSRVKTALRVGPQITLGGPGVTAEGTW